MIGSKKILHIETGRHLYGGALQVLYLIRGLKQNGMTNLLVCTKGSTIAKEAAPFARVYKRPMVGDMDILFLMRLLALIRREKPHLVHVHSRRGADLWGGLAARLARLPAVITRRVDNPESPWLAKIKYGLYDQVVTISEGIRQVLISQGLPASRIICVRSGLDPTPYSGPCRREWFQAQFDLRPEERAIGMVAQFIPRKGHRLLISVLPEVLRHFPAARFLFFGKGPLEQEIRSMVRAKGLEGAVRFAGFREDLPQILPCLDLLVHPALMEGLGVSLLQASAAGIPVVAARAGGIPEAVEHGRTGVLVHPGNPVSLSRAIIQVLQDPSAAEAMGRAGRKRVKRLFSVEQMVEGNLEIYRRVLARSHSTK